MCSCFACVDDKKRFVVENRHTNSKRLGIRIITCCAVDDRSWYDTRVYHTSQLLSGFASSSSASSLSLADPP